MENSFDSTSSEPTISALRSVFNKPTNFNAAFEVSLNESTTVTQINRSDFDAKAVSRSNSLRPFKMQMKSAQEFSVSAHESALSSDNEQSRVLVKPKFVSAKEQTADSFNVTFNESNSSPTAGTSLREESLLVKKSNPFKQINKENEMSVRIMESEQSHLDSPITFSDSENVESTTFPTKPKPFRKSKKDTSEKLDVSGSDSVREKNGSGFDEDSTLWARKENPFERRKSVQETSHLSLTEQRTCESSLRNKSAFTDKEGANISISLSKTHSESCVNESSINDENLNNWMSDVSEDEVLPPRIPSVTKNLSFTKEKQNTPRAENSPQKTNWGDKIKDIVSNAQRKGVTQVPTPQNLTKSKKATATENKEKKYRPKKLIKPASFATKGLYQFILKKFKSKYGIDAILEAEDMVLCICDTVEKVQRRKSYQKSLIQTLKKKMAKAELIETTMDFYEFVIKYLPHSFRVKVVPCLQPVSNTVYPPKDGLNPFDKIL